MLAAMLEMQGELFASTGIAVLKAKKKIGAKEGDFLTLINIFLRVHRASPADRKRICGELRLRVHAVEQALKIHE